MSRFKVATLLVLAAGILAAAVVTPGLRKPEFHGTDLGPDAPRRDFTLNALAGPISLSDFRGRVAVIFFGYTSCPDICPPTMARLARAMELVGKDRRDVQVLLVTVDPEVDTPERLHEYVRAFDPSFLGLHGEETLLRQVAGEFGAWGGEPREESGGESPDGSHPDHDTSTSTRPESRGMPPARLIAHTSHLFGVDRAGRLRVLWNGDTTAEELAEDLRTLLRL